MYFCGWGVCEGVGIYVYMVRRVRMYWEGGRRETTPLFIFVTLSSLVHEKILSHQPDKDD